MLSKMKQRLRPSAEATQTAKGALLVALQVAEKALDGVPVPGAKASVGAILTIIRMMEKTSQNAEVLTRIIAHVQGLHDESLTPVSCATVIAPETKVALEQLGRDIDEKLKPFNDRSKQSTFRRFFNTDRTDGDLQSLLIDIRHIVERYQVGALARGELSNARLENTTAAIGRKTVEVKDGTVRIGEATTRIENTTTRIEENTARIGETTARVEKGTARVEESTAKVKAGTARLETHLKDAIEFARMTERTRLINSLPRAEKAAVDSARDGGPLSCLEGTRVAVLNDIMDWVQSSDPDTPPVFWLVGLAGTGKSTIARTITETTRAKGWLGANFFFSRLIGGALCDPNLVFPTIAYQLAQFRGDFQATIADALELNADLGHRKVEEQLLRLIIEPLIRIGPSDKIVLVVLDALDECVSEPGIANILQLLLAHASRVPFRFRFFLTSQPEHHLHSAFAKAKGFSKFVLHDIAASVVRDDIEHYIRAELGRITVDLGCSVPDGWPVQKDVDQLVDNSGKLFVYAVTVVRFIEDNRICNPQRQLSIILGAKQVVNAKPLRSP